MQNTSYENLSLKGYKFLSFSSVRQPIKVKILYLVNSLESTFAFCTKVLDCLEGKANERKIMTREERVIESCNHEGTCFIGSLTFNCRVLGST